jgi:astacin
MRGGQQDLSLADGCGFGAAVHEFGHAWGLWHEQSREDRDSFVTVNWQNITPGQEHNFNQHITDGDDIGAYDYGSIMHYGMYAFSKNGQPTIVPKQAGVTIGQRNGLSAGDIAAVHHLYRTLHTNLTVALVYATPHSENAWANFTGLGWRKIDPNTPDGVTDTFEVLAVSRATGRPVHAELDGGTVYAAYGN